MSRARALPRRLLAGGAAGDAVHARGGQIASNIVVQLVGRAIAIALSVVTVALTARTLDPGGFGVLTSMAAYVGLFSVFTELGLSTAAMQRMAADPERESEWLGALVAIRLLLSLVVFVVCSISIVLFLSNAHEGHLVGVITALGILYTAPGALMTVFQSRLRAGLVFSFTLLQSVLWLAIVVVLTLTHASVVAFAATSTALLVVIGGLQIWTARRLVHVEWRKGIRHWRALVRVAVPLGVASVLITVYYQIDSVLLLQMAGPHEAGIYGAAYRFLAPLALIPAAVMSGFFPVFSAVYHDDPQRVRRLVQSCADLMGVISLPILALMVGLSEPIVRLLYDSGYARSAGLMPILMLAFVSICFGSLAGYMAPVLALQWRLAIYSGIGAIANVILNIVLIPPYGAYGSAWATVVTEVLTMVLMLGTCLVTLRLRLSPVRLLRTLVLTAAMIGAMELSRPLGAVPTAIAGVLVLLGGALALRVVDRDELLALRRSVRASG
ncbi:MAG TPA: flippase [Solirubrobacteraceae bacterium]|nr:flippase [Solirubrobacteraceae bacterium]